MQTVDDAQASAMERRDPQPAVPGQRKKVVDRIVRDLQDR